MPLVARTIRTAIFFVLFLCCADHVSGSSHETVLDRQLLSRYLVRTLDAIDRALRYVQRNVQVFNIDGIIGLREVESKVAYLSSTYWPILDPNITRKMRNVVYLAGDIAQVTTEIVKKATPKYYAKSYPLILPHFWDQNYPNRHINTSLIRIIVGEPNRFSEDESDDCLAELYGTLGHQPCTISHHCWQLMMGKRYSAYSLTHQLFYLLNGLQSSCTRELHYFSWKYERRSIAHIMDYLCSNIYSEALTIEKQGFPKVSMDLFMEQIGLCGDAGYMDLAKWRWLPKVLSLQRPNGCFGVLPGEKINPENFNPNGYGKSKRSRRIAKRVEQLMSDDGCLAHRISVAFSALVSYARRLTEHVVGA